MTQCKCCDRLGGLITLLLRGSLQQTALFDGILDCEHIFLELLTALDITVILTEGVELAEEPGFFHSASQGENVLCGANLQITMSDHKAKP